MKLPFRIYATVFLLVDLSGIVKGKTCVVTVNIPLRKAYTPASFSSSELRGSASDVCGADDGQIPNDYALFEAAINASQTYSFANLQTPPNCYTTTETCNQSNYFAVIFENYAVTEPFEIRSDGWPINQQKKSFL